MVGMPAIRVPIEPALPQPRAATALGGLSVVLPCRQAERTVAPAIRALARAAADASAAYEIVVVDDGSRDGTVRNVAGFVGPVGPVRLLVHPHRRGYGAALRTGLAAATLPWILLATAGEELDAADLARLIALTASADVVVGRRAAPPRLAAGARNRLARARGLHLHDADCPVKLLRAELLTGFELRGTSRLVAEELLLRCQAAGARITECPVDLHPFA
jgi:glycosyltransferase involved in cell wall biosynthesis